MNILDKKYSEIILEEKAMLESLVPVIKSTSNEKLERKLNSARDNLENLFSVVFIGEFSTGKSTKMQILDSLIPLKSFYKTHEAKLLQSNKRVEAISQEFAKINESVS